MVSWGQVPSSAPLRDVEVGSQKPQPGHFPTGALENPMEPIGLRAGRRPRSKLMDVPTSFNWRDDVPVGTTAIRDQNPHGTCWIFGSLASLEGAIKLNESPVPEPDLAERDIGAGNAPGAWDGGHTRVVANHLSAYGTINESDRPYSGGAPNPIPEVNYWNPPAGSPQHRIQEWHYLGDMDELTDVDALQQIIYDNGPVTASMSVATVEGWDSNFSTGLFNGTKVVPYLPTSNPTDHCVCIVGWDDNKSHFGGGGTGAWLVRNSWSTSWSSTEGGYFWIAYGSARIGATAAYYPQSGYEAYDADEGLMYYDEFGCFGQMGWTDLYTVYCIAAFTPNFTGNRELTKVAFWAKWNDLNYEIRVWDTWDRSGTPSSQLGSTETGSLTDAGYYTIDLSTPIDLTSGNEIFVQVKITNPNNDYYYLVPYEYQVPWFSNSRTTESGKCYASYLQSFGWIDLSSSYGDVGVRCWMAPPSDDPTSTPTSTPTVTNTPTETPTSTSTPTLTPTPTATEPPEACATIVVPPNNASVIGDSVSVQALVDLPPESMNHVLFQYRALPAGSWTDIDLADTDFPYYAHWDASTAGEGSYELRAVAQNSSGADCSTPAVLNVDVSSADPDITESGSTKTQKVSSGSSNEVRAADSDSDNAAVAVSVPGGSLSGNGTLTVQHVGQSGSLGEYGDLSCYVDISAGDGTSLTGPATVTFDYPPSLNSEALQIYYRDGSGLWRPLSGRVVDTNAGTISATISSDGSYALLEGLSQSTTIHQGWNIIGFPGIAHETDPEDIFGDDVDTVYFKTYDEVQQKYVFKSTLDPGRGYILWSSEETEVSVDGYGSKQYDNPVQLSLSYSSGESWAGWHFAANPFVDAIGFDDIYADPGTTNINNRYWTWNGTDYQFHLQGTASTIDPWTGFWVQATAPGAQISFPRPSGGTAKPIQEGVNPAENPTVDDWRLQISASSGEAMDRFNFVGVSPSSIAELDSNDVQDLSSESFLSAVGKDYVSLYVPHPEWATEPTTNYAQDVRAVTETVLTWDFTVSTSKASGQMFLTWPNIELIPADWQFTLKDVGTGAEIDMRTMNNLEYEIDGLSRQFQLSAEWITEVKSWQEY